MTIQIRALDLSLTGTGVARVRLGDEGLAGDRPIGVRTIGSASVPNAKYPPTLERLRRLTSRIIAAVQEDVEEGDTLIIAIEGPSLGSKVGLVHVRAGLWWLVYHMVSKLGTVVVIPPSSLKQYVTGNGNAPKDEVYATIVRSHPYVGIVNDNEADALGLASMVARELGFILEPSHQWAYPAALAGVDWPDIITQRRTHRG